MSDKTHRKLRDCFGLFATGVIVAATEYDDRLYGMTINSFSSVSLEPPLLLFSIHNDSFNLEAFKKSGHFALSILSNKQIALAQEFAKPNHHDKKWESEPYFSGKLGSPIFQNSLGFFECKTHKITKAGDHHIVIGEITDYKEMNVGKPLLYIDGNFFIST